MFLCSFLVDGDSEEINWFSPNGEKILTKRDNLEVRNHGNSLSSLIVLNANLNNAGIYKCASRNGDTESQATVKLDILCKYLHYIIIITNIMKRSEIQFLGLYDSLWLI